MPQTTTLYLLLDLKITMINKLFSKLFDSNEKQIKAAQPTVDKINALEKELEKKKLEDFQKRIEKMREELDELVAKVPEEDKQSVRTPEKGKDFPKYEIAIQDKLQEFLPEVFAMIREVTKRKMRKGDKFIRQFDVQLLAATILSQGQKLTELKTGEGKTLVFQMPAALYSLVGRGSHVMTVNDYLARRDGEYAGHILSDLGITVGIITPEKSYKYIKDEDVKALKGEEAWNERKNIHVMNPGEGKGLNLIEVSKKEAYECDIVYGTNNEFGFDYLRDNMSTTRANMAQGELYFCIVDEADSILIDEARTPLIISAPAEDSNDLYKEFARVVTQLEAERDYTVDEKAHSAAITDEGAEKVEKILGVSNLWEDYRFAHHLDNALKAMALYKRDDEYLVRDGEILIVDEFTGRVLAGRRYSEGLHQAIEAKEGVEIKKESKTLATITFQNFFRLYKILSGGSGTIMTEAEEFYKIYHLDSVIIPTNRQVIRDDQGDRVYKNQEAKFTAIAEEIIERNKKGQPVLIGTTSIEKSEYLSGLLDKRGIEHEVLNAKYHEREAQIVANAGKKGAVTVATNMAGRGTDIKLGGADANDKEVKEVIDLGGLHIIGSERHEARRIDNQLRGRSGRQGEPGSTRFYVGLDDEIMRIQGGGIVQKLMEMTKIPDDMPIEAGLIGRSIENAQKRMEGAHFDMRKQVVDYDDVANKQREIFYKKRRNILVLTEKLAAELAKDKLSDKGKDLKDQLVEKVKNLVFDEIDNVVNSHFFSDRNDSIDKKKLAQDFLDIAPDDLLKTNVEELEKEISSLKEDEIADKLKDKAEKAIDKKVEDFGKDFPQVVKTYYLQAMDEGWTEHLDSITDLRHGIGLRGYAQRDPLVEFKNEAFHLFDKFMRHIDGNFSRIILKVRRVVQSDTQPVEIKTNANEVTDVLTGDREMEPNQSSGDILQKPRRNVSQAIPKVGRNDLCPCGSGKKYKKCHGKGK